MSRRLLLGLALGAVLIAAVVAVALVRQRQATPPGEPGPAAARFEVLFTTPEEPGAAGRLDQRLVAAIDATRHTLDVAIYDLELDNVAEALVRAQRRGVRVRLVTEADNAGNAAVQRVRAAGVPVVTDNGRAFMHHKFAVFDGEMVLTGSWNFAPRETFQYNNNVAFIRSPELAAAFTEEFETMFVQRRFGATKPRRPPPAPVTWDGITVQALFAPAMDVPGPVIARIRAARESIAFLAFAFTHDGIGMAMVERARAGVRVRGVVESLQSDRPEGELGRLRAAGLTAEQGAGQPAPTCQNGPGVLTDGNPGLMHHKVIIIDGRTVIFGSFNFTRNAAEDNDENLVIVDSPAIAARFLEEFCRVYNRAAQRADRR